MAENILAVGGALLYVTNWLRTFGLRIPLAHTWSLSVEEQFYLAWPIGLIGLAAWGGLRRVIQGAAVLIVLATLQIGLRSVLGFDKEALYEGTDVQGMIFLMSGCSMPFALRTNSATLLAMRRATFPTVLTSSNDVRGANVPVSDGTAPFIFLGGFTVIAILMSLLVANALLSRWLATALDFRPLFA